MNSCGKLIVISGPSGVGKGTLLKEFLHRNPKVKLSISATTRDPREGEQNAVNYYFVETFEFDYMIKSGGLLEWAKYNQNYYGTPKKAVEDMLNEGFDVVLEIEVQGAKKIKELCKDASFIFIMPPSEEVLKQRLIHRHTESDEAVQRRLAIAIEEMECSVDYDYVIINDDLERAIAELSEVLQKIKQ